MQYKVFDEHLLFLPYLGIGRFSTWRKGINSGWDACGLGI